MKVKFYVTASGRSPVEEFIDSLSADAKLEIADAISRLESDSSLTMPLSRNLSNLHRGLHELKLRDRGGQIRIIYYVKKAEAIYLIHGFRKKTQQMPQNEIAIVLKRVREI